MANHDRRQPRAPAQFERHLMSAYLAGAGQDVETLLARTDDQARQLLVRALEYASEKSSEMYVRECYLSCAVPTPYLYE
jgi:hypothetical protein